jgi:predicted nucleotidyltransferase
MKLNGTLDVPDQAIADFCRRWRISEFALFGSVLRDDFGPESDVDVLVRFERPVRWGLFDLVHMENELSALMGRKVDIQSRAAIENSPNYIRRRAILNSAKTVYGG